MVEIRKILQEDPATQRINADIAKQKSKGWSAKGISDGYHTFEELYYHRMILFLTIMRAYPNRSWRSKLHDDGTMFEDSFIVGVDTPEGQYTYHYNLKYWDKFNEFATLEKAPKFDGHQPSDIDRLLSLRDGESPMAKLFKGYDEEADNE